MGLLDSRHTKIALVAAPLLGVATYVALDHHLAAKPAPAVPGRSYPLAEGPSCRYASGFCLLKNADVELRVDAKRLSASQVKLVLSTDLPLEHALVAVGTAGVFDAPAALVGEQQLSTSVSLADPERDRLRWAVVIAGVTYYAETSTAFVDRERIVVKSKSGR